MAHTRKRAGATALGLSAIAAIAFVPATPAQADPSIKDVKSRVDRLYHEAEAAQERLHDARLDLADLERDLAGLKADQARQDVVHRHILVDGKVVDRPSFRVKPGQTIQVRPRSQVMVPFQVAAAGAHRDVLPPVPEYLNVDLEKLSATLVRRPKRDEVPVTLSLIHI